ncbi:DUF3710 domain-containing protein [Corynebacterium frankenforstense]
MAIWPFGNNDKHKHGDAGAPGSGAESAAGAAVSDTAADAAAAQDAAAGADAGAADAAAAEAGAGEDVQVSGTGETGPFDGDSVNIEDFDFSDFASGVLNLGSLRLPLPKGSQVQVEMGEQGPRMLHVVTRHGRITPVAFAAPRSGGQWRSTVTEIVAKMKDDGLAPEIVDGPWGREIVAPNENGQLRLIGVDGPRWMLRFTLAAPTGHEQDLADEARDLFARTFVYRGQDPVLAGNSLPVALPAQLVEQLQQAMKQRAAQQNQQNPGGGAGQPGGTTKA